MAAHPYVLIMEDDSDILEALDLLLSSEGILWQRAEGPIDRERPPAVALLDLSTAADMAAEVETLRALAVPIIVASASPDAREKASDLGAFACVEKPFDLHALIAAIRRAAPVLGRRRK